MKTTEFIKKMEEYMFMIFDVDNNYEVYDCGKLIAIISKVEVENFKIFNDGDRLAFACGRTMKIIEIIVSFAQTPIDLREEEKKYYLRHKWINDDDENYLNLMISDGTFEIYTKREIDDFKTQFTLEEIDGIKERFNTTLEDFELIEVEE